MLPRLFWITLAFIGTGLLGCSDLDEETAQSRLYGACKNVLDCKEQMTSKIPAGMTCIEFMEDFDETTITCLSDANTCEEAGACQILISAPDNQEPII